MIVEKIKHSGAVVVSCLVTNGVTQWQETRTYYGYTIAQAKRAYRLTLEDNGYRVVA